MSHTTFSLCVYCGSKPGHNPEHAKLARQVGQWLGVRGHELVYGGGSGGLMGIVADATAQHGGRVFGVIPQALVEKELARTECDELKVVTTMHERKHAMAERAHAFLALPGGIGTFEEFFEVWTWRQLGYHNKPIGLINHQGFYDGLVSFTQHSLNEGFMGEWQMGLIQIGQDPEALLEQLLREAQAT
jgi:uncharacterized protein (TIGR00730 family)